MSATVKVADDYVDPAKKTYVDTVAEQSLESAPDLEAAAGDETYERIGALVARAYVGHSGSSTFDEEANKIDSELAGAKLVKVAEPLTTSAAPRPRPRAGQPRQQRRHRCAQHDRRRAGEGAGPQGDGTVLVTPPDRGRAWRSDRGHARRPGRAGNPALDGQRQLGLCGPGSRSAGAAATRSRARPATSASSTGSRHRLLRSESRSDLTAGNGRGVHVGLDVLID